MSWLAAALTFPLFAAEPGPGLRFIDVGQGSALLVVEPEGGAIMIDSGPPSGAEAVVEALRLHDVDRIALWIHTHWDADHVGGFSRAVAGIDGVYPSADDPRVDALWDRGLHAAPSTDVMLLYPLLADGRRTDVTAGAEIEIGAATVWSIPLDRGGADQENSRGLAVCVGLPGLRLLAPGDLPSALVEAAAAACGDVDVLWASHHGSADGISAAVLELADPELVVVGAGHENAFCHPSPVTLGLLHDREVWITRAAGLAPSGPCEAIADVLAPNHHMAGGDVWVPLDPP